MKKIFHFFYNIIPFKKQLFTVIRNLKLPERVYRHLIFKGVFNVRIDESASFKIMHYGFQLENEIFWSGIRGGWEKESIKLWIELSKNSTCILDIGANTGIYSLIAKAVKPNVKVYALEPVKRVFEKLVANTNLNGYNIKCLELAASDSDGQATIYDQDSEHIYSVTVNQDHSAAGIKSHPVTIQIAQLDTLIKHYSIPKIDLIKMDVEQHEAEVLYGYKNHIVQHKPTMLIEILNNTIAQNIESFLNIHSCNYLYFNIDENGGVRKVNHLSKSDYYNFLLCSDEVARKLKLI
jgi:FkbM family methyltransferase